MPVRLRSLLTLGLSDLVSALHERIAALDASLSAAAAEGRARHAQLEAALADLSARTEDRLGRAVRGLEDTREAIRSFEVHALEPGDLREAIRGLEAQAAKVDAILSEVAAVKNLGGKLERDIEVVRMLVASESDAARRGLRAGLTSAVNLISLLPQLKITGVLPPFSHHGWEVTGEMAAYLFHLVRRHRPKLILELGSGSSTVLFAAAVRANGAGRIVSIEHDPEHRNRTAQSLEQTELADWVELVGTPLVEQVVDGRNLQWYDLRSVLTRLPGTIDILFIDGPPGRLQPLSRYPALPVLRPHLSPRATVIVDDGKREDEAQMIELWRELGIAFDAETLSFLPRAPVMLRMSVGEARVAELRRLAESPDAGEEGAPDALSGRRIVTS